MAFCDAQTELDRASCFACLDLETLKSIELSLLCQILQTLDPMADCDVQTLLNRAACFSCLQPGQQEAVGLQLLCEIVSQGGAQGGSSVTNGVGAPTDPPAGGLAGIYYQTDTGSIWFWDGAVWVLRIA